MPVRIHSVPLFHAQSLLLRKEKRDIHQEHAEHFYSLNKVFFPVKTEYKVIPSLSNIHVLNSLDKKAAC